MDQHRHENVRLFGIHLNLWILLGAISSRRVYLPLSYIREALRAVAQRHSRIIFGATFGIVYRAYHCGVHLWSN
jgi:hypothetical protein